MRRKSHVRFGERDGENRTEQSVYGVSVPTLPDPTPSPDDIRITQTIRGAAELMDISLLDHIIIAKDKYTSLKEKRLGF